MLRVDPERVEAMFDFLGKVSEIEDEELNENTVRFFTLIHRRTIDPRPPFTTSDKINELNRKPDHGRRPALPGSRRFISRCRHRNGQRRQSDRPLTGRETPMPSHGVIHCPM